MGCHKGLGSQGNSSTPGNQKMMSGKNLLRKKMFWKNGALWKEIILASLKWVAVISPKNNKRQRRKR